ncbi:MAG TPA: hypothetical protein PLU37_11265 [Chitinophagaceae bacterium]|nr:hypothetical protein [Chitinophagaceae bacterium]HPG12103.1 hypothetical protein [Chitinophagaceae bacterium]HRX93880.1 hypothetical protein [Chitinophagaceae bacterium]
MIRKGVLYIAFLAAPVLIFVSCSTQQKLQDGKNKMVEIDKDLKQQKNTLNKLDKIRETKLAENQILDTASQKIGQFIQKTRKEIQDRISEDSLMIGEVEVARADWNSLKKALTQSQRSLKSINNKVAFINDLLERNRVVKLDQDVIFQPGEYKVSDDVANSITNFFEPAAKGVDSFINKYPDFNLSLVITAKGYADGTIISETSDLYKELKEQLKLQTSSPSNKELNHQLSRLRAQKVIQLFQEFTTARAGNRQTSNEHILYLSEGKGEAYPDPTIKNYKVNDPRRRVVLLFWSIFPE